MYYFKFNYSLEFPPARGCLMPFASNKNETKIEIITWLIEYDEKEDSVSRELGLNPSNKAFYFAPSDTFYGFWLDADCKLTEFEKFDPTPISEAEFKEKWKEEFNSM